MKHKEQKPLHRKITYSNLEVLKLHKYAFFTPPKILTLLMLVGLSTISQAELVVTEASIHLGPMSKVPSAGYLTIQNKSQNEISIQALSTDHFEKVEWHETVISTDGIAKMRMKKTPVIPALSKVVLKRGGKHLMLYQPSKEIETKSEIDLVFKLSSGIQQSFPVKIHRHKKPHNH